MQFGSFPRRLQPKSDSIAVAKECPACGQPIDHEHAKKTQARIEAWRRERTNEIADGVAKRHELEKRDALEAAKRDADDLISSLRRQLELAAQAQDELHVKARAEAEAAVGERLAAAAQKEETLIATLQQERATGAMALEESRRASEAREQLIRRDATERAAEMLRSDMTKLAEAATTSQAAAAAAEDRLQAFQSSLDTMKEEMERQKDAALAAERSAAFEERQRIQLKFEELKRAYEKKSSEELGEGAEINLYQALAAEFLEDRIERVERGRPGADILQTVIHNGKECGKIIYDSKNHSVWRNEFVTKLAADQMDAKAEHAILSTSRFPAGARHLHVVDGVILAAPARIMTLVSIVRRHMIQTFALRSGNRERAEKTVKLYEFVTSEVCASFFDRIERSSEALLQLQEKEKRAHEANWRKQGDLVASVRKGRENLVYEIDRILGVHLPDPQLEESHVSPPGDLFG